jgi:serine O-acetyltransferase
MVKQDFERTFHLQKGNYFQKIILCYRSPGIHATVIYRFGRWLLRKSFLVRIFLEPFYALLYHRIRSVWGIEIPRTTKIGERLYIGHGGGIIVSRHAKLGNNVNISHQVTIGAAGKGEKRGAPTIGDNVYFAPGAKVIGKIKIGNNVKIGPNAVVYQDIPDNSIVVLEPGFKIISRRVDQSLQEEFRFKLSQN